MRSFSRDKKRTKPKSRSRKRPPTSDATISATAKSSRSHDQFDVETHPLWATLPTFTAQQWRESAKQEDNLRGMISSISTRDQYPDCSIALGSAQKLLRELNEKGYNLTGRVQILERKCYGGFSDIYIGMLDNKKVAIKAPRMNEVDRKKLIRVSLWEIYM